ncbi:MAG: class II fructose-bisphosphate aldolase, partial [Oscillospiraceae bacterium]|nr:class II fructose-bisphosphate aldolase [Oscillospiraceae bacterium]
VDIPLVLHGGSGLSDDDFRNTVAGGISKINVYTDIILAGRAALLADPHESYSDACLRAERAMQAACAAKLRLFGSAGRA